MCVIINEGIYNKCIIYDNTGWKGGSKKMWEVEIWHADFTGSKPLHNNDTLNWSESVWTQEDYPRQKAQQ